LGCRKELLLRSTIRMKRRQLCTRSVPKASTSILVFPRRRSSSRGTTQSLLLRFCPEAKDLPLQF
jgi:hypothetical protein